MPYVPQGYIELAQEINSLLNGPEGGKAKAFLKNAQEDRDIGGVYKKAIEDLFYRQDPELMQAIFDDLCICLEVSLKAGKLVIRDIGGSAYQYFVPTPSSQELYEFTMQELVEAGHVFMNVPGDGHCFYHAVSHQLSLLGITKSSTDLHEAAIAYLCGHPELYRDFVEGGDLDKYIAKHLEGKEWADTVIITALANALKMHINVNQPSLHTEGVHLVNTPIIPAETVQYVINLLHIPIEGVQHFLSDMSPSVITQALPADVLPLGSATDSLVSSEVSATEEGEAHVVSSPAGPDTGTLAVTPEDPTNQPQNDTNNPLGPSSDWYRNLPWL